MNNPPPLAIAREEMPSLGPLLHTNDISTGEVCVEKEKPYLGAVEHPDFIQSLVGCHGASEGHPRAAVSTEVTSLVASWFPVMS